LAADELFDIRNKIKNTVMLDLALKVAFQDDQYATHWKITDTKLITKLIRQDGIYEKARINHSGFYLYRYNPAYPPTDEELNKFPVQLNQKTILCIIEDWLNTVEFPDNHYGNLDGSSAKGFRVYNPAADENWSEFAFCIVEPFWLYYGK
jgi:hypothetical protein